MKTMLRKMQRSVALRWLMATVLVLSTGAHAAACLCSSGRTCEEPTGAKGTGASCTCGQAATHAEAEAPGGCCSTKTAPAPASPAKGCCSTHGDVTTATAQAHKHTETFDIAQAQLRAPKHACPCSISSNESPAFPAREKSVVVPAPAGDPRPDSAIVVTHDLALPSPSLGLAAVHWPEIAQRSTVPTAALLCTYRC